MYVIHKEEQTKFLGGGGGGVGPPPPPEINPEDGCDTWTHQKYC